jgi:hypothetical protein
MGGGRQRRMLNHRAFIHELWHHHRKSVGFPTMQGLSPTLH